MTIKFDIGAGGSIYSATQQCIDKLSVGQEGEFMFNGIRVRFYWNSRAEDIIQIYFLKAQIERMK